MQSNIGSDDVKKVYMQQVALVPTKVQPVSEAKCVSSETQAHVFGLTSPWSCKQKQACIFAKESKES